MTVPVPRDVRNNNPGNIRKNPANKWQGVAELQSDDSFVTFNSMPYGLRAMAILLIGYQDRKNAYTVPGLLSFWAPSSENDTLRYVKRVEDEMTRALGFAVTDSTEIDTHDYFHLRALMEAMIRVESGFVWNTWISDAQMIKGLALAGVEAPKKPLQASKTIKGAQVTAVAVAGQTAVGMLQQINDAKSQLEPLIVYSDYLKYLFIALAVIGIGVTVWAKIDERRKGIS